MQQEDDLRALAKIMEFGRAVSIFLLVVHVYVYCYPSITAWNLNLAVMDRILVNFNNTTGDFQLYSLEQTVGSASAGSFLSGYARGQR